MSFHFYDRPSEFHGLGDEEEASEGCHFCDGEGDADGECFACQPRCDLDYSPVRASFVIDTATGAVTERSL